MNKEDEEEAALRCPHGNVINFVITRIRSQMSSLACSQSVLHRDGSQLAKEVKHTPDRIALPLALKYGVDMEQHVSIKYICVCYMHSNPSQKVELKAARCFRLDKFALPLFDIYIITLRKGSCCLGTL